jgi:outer membrane protein TolC
LFQGGQLLHQRRAADAGLEAAVARYRSTVLGAFRNVADTLLALHTDADAVLAQRAAERAAAASLSIAEAQYRAGGTSFLTLLNAQTTHAQARIALIQAETNRFADTAALYQALGGGWWNRPAPPSQES